MADKAPGNVPSINSEGKQTNPTANLLMADTGALTSRGVYEVRAVCGGSAAGIFQLERRNVANDSTLGSAVVIYTPTAASGEYVIESVAEVGERFRVIMNAGLTGTAAATLQTEILI